jgi:hypothetical protein
VRLAAQLSVRPWVVLSARPLGPPWEVWPELRLGTRPVKRSIRQESRAHIRLVPEWEPLAVRLVAQLLVRPWVVPSAQSREPPWEVWPERRLGTRPVKRSIRRRKGNWRQNLKNRPLLARHSMSDYEAAYRRLLKKGVRRDFRLRRSFCDRQPRNSKCKEA